MTMYYRNSGEEGGGGKARPSLDYLRERSGSNVQPLAEVRPLYSVMSDHTTRITLYSPVIYVCVYYEQCMCVSTLHMCL